VYAYDRFATADKFKTRVHNNNKIVILSGGRYDTMTIEIDRCRLQSVPFGPVEPLPHDIYIYNIYNNDIIYKTYVDHYKSHW